MVTAWILRAPTRRQKGKQKKQRRTGDEKSFQTERGKWKRCMLITFPLPNRCDDKSPQNESMIHRCQVSARTTESN